MKKFMPSTPVLGITIVLIAVYAALFLGGVTLKDLVNITAFLTIFSLAISVLLFLLKKYDNWLNN